MLPRVSVILTASRSLNDSDGIGGPANCVIGTFDGCLAIVALYAT